MLYAPPKIYLYINKSLIEGIILKRSCNASIPVAHHFFLSLEEVGFEPTSKVIKITDNMCSKFVKTRQ
jgi:hypothetical protein